MRSAHGADTLSKSQINRWYTHFLANPDCNDKDLPHNLGPRKLVPAKVAEVEQAVARDRRVTCRQLARQGVCPIEVLTRFCVKISKCQRNQPSGSLIC